MALLKRKFDVGVIAELKKHDSIWLRNRILNRIKKEDFIVDNSLDYPVYRGYSVKENLYNVIRKYDYDIAVVQAGYPFSLINELSARRVPVIYYARDVEFQENYEELNLNRFVKIVANSAFTAQRVQERYLRDSTVIFPLVDLQKYQVSSRGQAVVHIGLSPLKGVETSLQLAEKRPDIPFVLVESWPLSKEKLNSYLSRAKKLKNVSILRRTSDMRKVYALAKVLIVPSVWEEAWGRVATEAQASGIPVLASNRGGLPESVGMGGIIVPHDADLDCWASKLSYLWDSAENYNRLSQAALARSRKEDISYASITDRFINCLQEHLSATSQ